VSAYQGYLSIDFVPKDTYSQVGLRVQLDKAMDGFFVSLNPQANNLESARLDRRKRELELLSRLLPGQKITGVS
jgi:hypothetical protein